MKRFLLTIGAAMLLVGCANKYTLVEPHPTTIGNFYTIEPQIPWSATQEGKAVLWTIHGPALEGLRFLTGIGDGDPLSERKDREKSPKFRKGMTAIEIKELVVDTLAAANATKIQTNNLKPFQFGGQRGFRFELTYLVDNGLEKAGLVVGSVIEERLYLIAYTGARAHYFPKHRDHVERIIESISMQ